MNKYLYYTINPTEQLFKQLSGFLYYLKFTKESKEILVLPRFELKGKLYDYKLLFDDKIIKDNFNVIDFDDYDPNSNTREFINGFESIHGDYFYFRKYVKYNKRYYDIISSHKIEPYLAIHWRQTDFIKLRQRHILSKEQLIECVKETLKETGLKKVYISTDSNDLDALKYIHEHLPTFTYEQQDNITDVDYSILESLICARAEYFIGTELSFYSSNIIGERVNMGKLDNYELRLPGRGVTTYSRKLTQRL